MHTKPTGQEEVPVWARGKQRNYARVLLVLIFGIGCLVTLLVLAWYRDVNTERASSFGMLRVQLVPGAESKWRDASSSFCRYSSGTMTEGATYDLYKLYYPADGTVNIDALCLALTNMKTISSFVPWVSLGGLAAVLFVAIYLSTQGPWRLGDRLKVFGCAGATFAFWTVPVIMASLWVGKFGEIGAAGLETKASVAVYLFYCCIGVAILLVPIAVLDGVFVAGYESLDRFQWADKDPLQVQRETALEAQAHMQQYQPPPQLNIPMGGLTRPGEVLRVEAPRQPTQYGYEGGYGKQGRGPAYGYGMQ